MSTDDKKPGADTDPATDPGAATDPAKSPGDSGVDVNKIVQDRLARQARQHESQLTAAREEAVAAFLDDKLGIAVDEIDQLRDTINAGRTSESEAKKLSRTLQRIEKERDDAQAQLATIAQDNRKRKIRDALTTAAGDNTHVRSVVALIESDGGLDLDDAGTVTVHGKDLSKVVKDLLAENPHLVKPTATDGGAGSRPNAGVSAGNDKLSPKEQLRKHGFTLPGMTAPSLRKT